jgi:DNA-binding SARP family transcriptional activator
MVIVGLANCPLLDAVLQKSAAIIFRILLSPRGPDKDKRLYLLNLKHAKLMAMKLNPEVQGPLKVRTFGQPEVLLCSRPVQWRSDSARQLFFYLLSYPQGQNREHIIETLWQTGCDAKASNRFRVTVHRIRLALGWPGAVLEEQGRYRLAQEVLEASDIYAFYQALNQARQGQNPEVRIEQYQAALKNHQGQYLRQEEGEWVGEARRQLHSARVQVQLELAQLLCGLGSCSASAQAQAQALQADPYLGEQHHQRLMGCLWATQGKYAATDYYRRFVRFLKQEIGDTPMLETIDLARQIKQDTLPCQHRWNLWPLEGSSAKCPLIRPAEPKHQPTIKSTYPEKPRPATPPPGSCQIPTTAVGETALGDWHPQARQQDIRPQG